MRAGGLNNWLKMVFIFLSLLYANVGFFDARILAVVKYKRGLIIRYNVVYDG